MKTINIYSLEGTRIAKYDHIKPEDITPYTQTNATPNIIFVGKSGGTIEVIGNFMAIIEDE